MRGSASISHGIVVELESNDCEKSQIIRLIESRDYVVKVLVDGQDYVHLWVHIEDPTETAKVKAAVYALVAEVVKVRQTAATN